MELIVISSERAIEGEAGIINDLFRSGMCRFHLRKPGSSIEQVSKLIDHIDPAFYQRIALHQYHELAATYNIARLHFTEQSRTRTFAKTLESQKEKGIRLSTSTHDARLIPSLSVFEYTFLSPVFDSLSKPGYTGTIKPGFRLENEDRSPRVIALGGVETDRLEIIKKMGFDGAAVLGAVWNQPQMALQTFHRLQAGITNLNIII